MRHTILLLSVLSVLSSCAVVTEPQVVYKYNTAWETYITQENDTLNTPLGFYSHSSEYTDSWCYDLASAVFPEWSDKQIETFIFSPKEHFEKTYPHIAATNYLEKWNYLNIK